MNKSIRFLSGILMVFLAAMLAVGCGSDDNDKNSSNTTKPSKTDSNISLTQSPATDTRVTLDRLLAEHASLASMALNSAVVGSKDTDAMVAQLDKNSVDLSKVIGSVYGDDAEKAFLVQWRAHIGFFVNYATALVKKDTKGQQTARQDLSGYSKSFAKFLGDATGLESKAAESALQAHVGQLLGALDAYNAKDYAKSFDLQREAYAHMFMTGDAIAGAIIDQQKLDNGKVTEEAAATRIALDRLLGEHMLLASQATVRALAGADQKEVGALVGAVDKNSVELSKVIGSVYGDDAAKAFLDGKDMWRAHIGYHVAYLTGVATDDMAAQDKAEADLARYVTTFSGFLAGATGLDQNALEEGLTAHVKHLGDLTDSYAAGDFEAAAAGIDEGYTHMFGLGDALAEAIVSQGSDKAPADDMSMMSHSM